MKKQKTEKRKTKEKKRTCGKLMRLGIANRIVVVKSNPKSEFHHRLMSIRISTIKIESTIAITIQNRSIFDLFFI